MPTLLESQTAIRQLATKAKETVENKDLTQAEVKTALDAIETDLTSHQENVRLVEQSKRLMAGGDTAVGTKDNSGQPDEIGKTVAAYKTIGQRVAESDAYKRAVGAKGGRFSATTSLDDVTIGRKTVSTVGEGSSVSGGFLTGQAGAGILPNYLPGILPLLFQPLVVADLFAQGATDSPLISYVVESQFQNSAAGVAEAGAKPQSDDTIARVAVQVGKLAHYMKMTDEMVADFAQYSSFLDNRLVLGLQLKEQDALLNGTGYPSVTGVLQTTGLQTDVPLNGSNATTGVQTVVEGVYSILTQLRTVAFIEPDAMVINPVDWQHIRLGKDANGQYYAGGPFLGAYGQGGLPSVDTLWGLRVVQTPAIASGKVLIGGFQQCAQLFRRQGVTVEMTNSNEDDFLHNLIAVRAEERLALAVFRPAGFGTSTVVWV